jgi:hypothetical protein
MKAFAFIFVTLLIFGVSGCQTAKYVECIARDNTSRPCN